MLKCLVISKFFKYFSFDKYVYFYFGLRVWGIRNFLLCFYVGVFSLVFFKMFEFVIKRYKI